MPAWSTILQRIIKTTDERNRLASTLGVTATTLTRWASGESKPHRQHLIHLLQFIHPDLRPEFIEALEESFPDLHSWIHDDTTNQIPSAFFAQVLNIRTTTTDSLRFWRISEVILKQALAQLDPNRLGLSVKLLQCMPPAPPDKKVHSLRERTGKGTTPWTADLEHDVLFLGVESLSGMAVEARHAVNNDNLHLNKMVPAVQDTFEVSAAAHPIRQEGRIVGCLLASSTQLGYFTQQRIALLSTFSDLLALAFDRHEFYRADQIALRVMPPPEVQRPILANFRNLVTTRLLETANTRPRMSNSEIELLVWQELEKKLIREQRRLLGLSDDD